MKSSRFGLFLFGVGLLALSGCSRIGGERKSSTQLLKEGVVKITYGNEPGHATGFFIEGEGEGCTVLTVAHAVPEGRAIRVTAYGSELFEVVDVQRADHDDLAVMTFEAAEGDCPYAALRLGDSTRLEIDDFVRMAGYPERAGAERLVLQFPSGKVTSIERPPLPDGYAISYDMITVGGMSGAPVVDEKGRVVGVHGLTDSELVSLGRAQQSSLSDAQKDELEEAEDRVEGLARINHFKWGIPIQTFVSQRDSFVTVAKANVSEEDALEAEAQEVSELIAEGDELRAQKKYEEALELYEQALEIDSRQKEGWYGKGYSLVELERYEEAIVSYDKALELDPDYVFAWNNRGVALVELKRYEEAIAAYDKAIELDPNNAKAWTARGFSLESLERYEEAVISHDKAIELDPDYSLARYNRGISLRELERYEEAITSYDKAIELDPNNAKTWYDRGTSLGLSGRSEEAVASYDKAIELDPDYAEAWYGRGWALESLNRDRAALESYEKAVEIDPDLEIAVKNLARLKSELE